MNYRVNTEKIREYMLEKGISKRETARRMGIDDGHLVKVLNGEKNAGAKVVRGMLKIGCKLNEIFKSQKCQKSNGINENIVQNICDYMNTMSVAFKKEYTLYDVYNIKNAIEAEKKDRRKNEIKINGNTVLGRKELNRRIANIANQEEGLNMTSRDIQLYKKCASLEAKDRNLINKLEEEIS